MTIDDILEALAPFAAFADLVQNDNGTIQIAASCEDLRRASQAYDQLRFEFEYTEEYDDDDQTPEV